MVEYQCIKLPFDRLVHRYAIVTYNGYPKE
jgi:hypothetical protein